MSKRVGEQLAGKTLYETQRVVRSSPTFVSAPMIIACGLHAPENVGAVLRLADAAGSARVAFVSTEALNIQEKQVRRIARNCDAIVDWKIWTLEQFLSEVGSLPPLIALELTTRSTSLFVAALPETCGLVIGNERFGIPVPILEQCAEAIHIPMYGVNGSMNVSHALAIALFEWRRQHTTTAEPVPPS